MQLLKLYVLVRADLSKSQQAVQAGHALAQFLLEHRDTAWDNGTLVYLKVPDEQVLQQWAEKLKQFGISTFREPDIGDQLTAIAALGVGEHVRGLSLM